MLFRNIGHGLIYCLDRYVQVFLGVSVTNIPMMVRSQEDTSADQLRVKIVTSRSLGTGLILLEGYKKPTGGLKGAPARFNPLAPS